MKKIGFILAFIGMAAFLGHFEHGGHDHSKNLKDHDCICHTTGMTSPAALNVVSSITFIETLQITARTVHCDSAPLFLNSPRAPPATSIL